MDTTKQKFFEKLFLALKNINQLIIREDDQNSLFEKMCENLIKDLGFSIVVVGEIDNTNNLKIIHKKGENSQLFDDIPISINGKSEYGKGTAYLAYKTNTVIINQNTLTNPAMNFWKDKLLKYNLHSNCAIPIKKMVLLNTLF